MNNLQTLQKTGKQKLKEFVSEKNLLADLQNVKSILADL